MQALATRSTQRNVIGVNDAAYYHKIIYNPESLAPDRTNALAPGRIDALVPASKTDLSTRVTQLINAGDSSGFEELLSTECTGCVFPGGVVGGCVTCG